MATKITHTKLAAMQNFSLCGETELFETYGTDDRRRMIDLMQVLARAGEDVFSDQSGQAIWEAIAALESFGYQYEEPTDDHVAIGTPALDSPYRGAELEIVRKLVEQRPCRLGERALILRAVHGWTWADVAEHCGLSMRSVRARAKANAQILTSGLLGHRLVGCGKTDRLLPKVIFGFYADSAKSIEDEISEFLVHEKTCRRCAEVKIQLVRGLEIAAAVIAPRALELQRLVPGPVFKTDPNTVAADVSNGLVAFSELADDELDRQLEREMLALESVEADEALADDSFAQVNEAPATHELLAFDYAGDERRVAPTPKQERSADAAPARSSVCEEDRQAEPELTRRPLAEESVSACAWASVEAEDSVLYDSDLPPLPTALIAGMAIAGDVDPGIEADLPYEQLLDANTAADFAASDGVDQRVFDQAENADGDRVSAVAQTPRIEVNEAGCPVDQPPAVVVELVEGDGGEPEVLPMGVKNIPSSCAPPRTLALVEDPDDHDEHHQKDVAEPDSGRFARRAKTALAIAACLLLVLVVALGGIINPGKKTEPDAAQAPAAAITVNDKPAAKKKRHHKKQHARRRPTSTVPAAVRAPRPAPVSAPATAAPGQSPAGDGTSEFLPEGRG